MNAIKKLGLDRSPLCRIAGGEGIFRIPFECAGACQKQVRKVVAGSCQV